MKTTILHALLPQALVGAELGSWLRANSIESFNDEVKNYFSPEDIAEFEHESSKKGREMNMLNGLLKSVTDAVKKGCDEDLVIEIPKNLGTKILDEQRRQDDDFIDAGYETEDVRVFGLIDHENETMEYFTETGIHVESRSRNLTPKEKREYLTISIERKLDSAVNQ